MRIVIDMQGAQGGSRFRGIGRLTLELARAMVRERGQHEVMLALSGQFPESIESIRAAFDNLIPQENIRVWRAPGPMRESDPANRQRREIAERVREAFLLSLQPDAVLVGSLFEGLGDDSITSVGVFDTRTPTAVILYDLIPLINPDINFRTNQIYQSYYKRKIDSLRRSKRLLAISDSARNEALSTGWFSERDVVNISAACDSSFQVLNLSDFEKLTLAKGLGISRPFVMYTGGADERKNLPRLIAAYAGLPGTLRSTHQLVMVGKMPENSISDLYHTARKSGLAENELVFTGYVTDIDLIKLYNSCKLFVFPSLHEGFGLPPLEAMACGRPVIVANVTSLKEVVGRAEATFDPESTESIKAKMDQALSDEKFRTDLIRNGLVEAKKFSWERSARRALDALKDFEPGSIQKITSVLSFEKTSKFVRKKKKILLTKLDHMGDLILAIPAMSKLRARYPYASLEIVVGSWNVALAKELRLFDKIHSFDFFRPQSAQAASATDTELKALLSQLGAYDIAIDLRRQRDTRFVLVEVAAELRVGYQTFDPSIDTRLHIALNSFADAPFVKTPLNGKHASLQMLELVDALPEDIHDFINLPLICEKPAAKRLSVAMFPNAGNNVKEWAAERYWALATLLAGETDIEAVNVYFAKSDDVRKSGFSTQPKIHIHVGLGFSELARSLSSNTVCVANNSFGAHLASYLGLVVIGVYGGHETVDEWAPIFGDSYVIHRQAHCSPCHIAKQADCLNNMYCLVDIAISDVHTSVVQAMSAIRRGEDGRLAELISGFKEKCPPKKIIAQLLASIAALDVKLDDREHIEVAESIAVSIPTSRLTKRLFVDVSELVLVDAKSGIQRVTKGVLRALQQNPPVGYVVTPVYAGTDRAGYFCANKFSRAFFGQEPYLYVSDDPIEYSAGDIFLGLDLQPVVIPAQKKFFQLMRQDGVKVVFVVHDLLCVRMPQYFPEPLTKAFENWLQTIAEGDGALCVSQATANDLKKWIDDCAPQRSRPFKIDWFHNGTGTDDENSSPTLGLNSDALHVLQTLGSRPSFLMVGTLEPRKGHAQSLEAFEKLWIEGLEINLVIVGKNGWGVDELAKRLRNHPELGKRLFWLEGISDEYLGKVYAVCSCLIAASEGEGFGLPLIEAAQHKLPILARDIPIFREVAGAHAFYFSSLEAVQLASAVKQWLVLFREHNHPRSDNLPWLTWKQSTQKLVDSLLSL